MCIGDDYCHKSNCPMGDNKDSTIQSPLKVVSNSLCACVLMKEQGNQTFDIKTLKGQLCRVGRLFVHFITNPQDTLVGFPPK